MSKHYTETGLSFLCELIFLGAFLAPMKLTLPKMCFGVDGLIQFFCGPIVVWIFEILTNLRFQAEILACLDAF